MKLLLVTLILFCSTVFIQAVELRAIPHRIIDDNRIFVRDATDRRYSVWTDNSVKASEMKNLFGIHQEETLELKEGEIFVIFLNDRIEEDLIQITRNETANQTFADYADSGIRKKLMALEEGKKYSHLTALIFTLIATPSHIGIRGMITGGLSEKK